MPVLHETPGVAIHGVRVMFSATPDTRVGTVAFDADGIQGVTWKRASMLDTRPVTPPASRVEMVVLEFDGILVETADPNVLANVHDPEWRKRMAEQAKAGVAAAEHHDFVVTMPPEEPGA